MLRETDLTLRLAAELYSAGNRERMRYLDRIVARSGDTPLRDIDSSFVQRLADVLYPQGLPATHLRQVWAPLFLESNTVGPTRRETAPAASANRAPEPPRGAPGFPA